MAYPTTIPVGLPSEELIPIRATLVGVSSPALCKVRIGPFAHFQRVFPLRFQLILSSFFAYFVDAKGLI